MSDIAAEQTLQPVREDWQTALCVVAQPVTELFGEAERHPYFVIHGAIMSA